MHSPPGPDDPAAPWRTPAAYFYALDLDGPALAWEYLRRHPGYRDCWSDHRQRRREATTTRWGLRGELEDPHLDARHAHPLWNSELATLLHAHAISVPAAPAGSALRFWEIPGRKRIVHGATDLVLTAAAGPHWLRVAFARDLDDGAACHCTVPLGPRLRARLAQFQAQAEAIRGRALAPPFARRAARAPVLHLRALQALDAAQAGATHRDIAEAVLGSDAVRSRWSADGELRAQVRHLLARAEGLMRGGYLALAGVRRPHPGTPGDEPGA
jgi:hypothetical protein